MEVGLVMHIYFAFVDKFRGLASMPSLHELAASHMEGQTTLFSFYRTQYIVPWIFSAAPEKLLGL